MISEFILTILFGLIIGFINLMPSFSLPSGLIPGVQTFFSLVNGIGYFFPLDTFVIVVSSMIILYNIKVVVDIIGFVISKIPGISR